MNILAQTERKLCPSFIFYSIKALCGWMVLFQIDERGSDLLSPVNIMFSSGNSLGETPSIYQYYLNKPSERVEWIFPGLTQLSQGQMTGYVQDKILLMS